MARDLTVRCPCCSASLEVDARTGRVLRHVRPGAPKADPFAQGLERARKGDESDDAFRSAQQNLETRRKEAEDRFSREADRARREKAEGKEIRPPNPFDNE